MTGPRESDRLVHAFLQEGPTTLPDRAVDGILASLHVPSAELRFGPRAAWRPAPQTLLAFAAGVAATVLVGATFLGIRLTPMPAGVVGPASPSASASAVTTPTPTPNGFSGTILYSVADDSTKLDRLYALPADGTTEAALLLDGACCPVIGPGVAQGPVGGPRVGGILVLYGTTLPDGRPTVGLLRLHGVNGQLFEPPLDPPGNVGFSPGPVSPVGWNFAFEGQSDAFPVLSGVYLSIDNGGQYVWGDIKQLTHAPAGTRDIPVAFSPDGTRILFLRRPAQTTRRSLSDVFVVHTDGSGILRLTPTGTHVVDDSSTTGAAWAAAGTQVRFVGVDAAGLSSLYSIDANSGEVLGRVKVTGTGFGQAAFSSDGTRVAIQVEAADGAYELYEIRPDGGRAFLAGAYGSWQRPAWSPDASAIVAMNDRDEQSGLSIVSLDGAPPIWIGPRTSLVSDYVWAPASP
jgi:hypothetical protein